MREEDSNWFSKWEEELPSPDELMPISQTLITRDLALAFDIGNSGTTTAIHHHHHHHQLLRHHQSSSAPPPPAPQQPNSAEFDSSSAELGGGGGSGSGLGGAADEPARTLKRPRLVWTPQLHKRFVDAVAHLGIKNAVPKTIMQLMSVDGLTRENVASHLQKYRLYLKRMQGLNTNGPGSSGPGGSGDPATDRLFASSPVPAHFLHQGGTGGGGGAGGGGRPNSDHFMPYMPLHHQQIGVGHAHLQAQYPHRQLGHYGSGGAHFDQHLFVSRQAQAELGPSRNGMLQISGYVEDMESGTAADDRRKVLTLFPTGD